LLWLSKKERGVETRTPGLGGGEETREEQVRKGMGWGKKIKGWECNYLLDKNKVNLVENWDVNSNGERNNF